MDAWLSNVDKRKAVVPWSPNHSKGGEAVLGDLELVSGMVAAVLLCGSEHESKSSFKNVEVASIQQLVKMFEGAVKLAVGTVLDKEARKAQDAEHQTLGEGRKVVHLDLGKLVIAAYILEDSVKAVEYASPVVEVASRPAPFRDAVEYTRKLIIG